MESDLKKASRDKIMTSLVLGAAFVVAVLGVIFGLTQSSEATHNREMAIANQISALEAKQDADRQRDIANEQTALALQREKELEVKNKEVREALIEAYKARIEAEKALKDCRNKK